MHPARRGMTLIEVVVATMTLAVGAAMIAGGLSFSANVSDRNRQRLAAAEVAHRIIITHVRDPRELAGQPERVLFDGRYYAFQLDEEVLTKEVTEGAGASGLTRRTTRKSSDLSLDEKLNNQLTRITVRVRLDEPSEKPRPVLATMTRMFNPYAGDAEALLWRLMNDPSISTQLDR
jgi:type II secretory pathway pseudopilin PulG